jgi:hypothetical protein
MLASGKLIVFNTLLSAEILIFLTGEKLSQR